MELQNRLAIRVLLSGAGFILAAAAPGQSMVEYGHGAAGAVRGAAALRNASPASTFDRVGRSLPGSTSGSTRTAHSSAHPRTTQLAATRSALPEPLTVLRVGWDAPGDLEASAGDREFKTLARKNVFAASEKEAPVAEPFNLEEYGLQRSMKIQEVVSILGDPAVRAAGLDGAGYDEKLLFRLQSGWQVVVFSARGRVQTLVASPDPRKTQNGLLHRTGSVIP